jgi:hypothetical protein
VVTDHHFYPKKAHLLVRDYADSLQSSIPSTEIVEEMTSLFSHLLTPAGSLDYTMTHIHINFLRLAASLPPLEPLPVAKPSCEDVQNANEPAAFSVKL